MDLVRQCQHHDPGHLSALHATGNHPGQVSAIDQHLPGGIVLSADQLTVEQDQIAGIDWNMELSQEPDPDTQPLPEREATSRYQLSLPIDGWKLGLPSGSVPTGYF